MKKILIVVDYQHDFVDGVLPVANAEEIRENIQNLIDDKDYDNIIYTFDTHTPAEYEKSFEKTLFPNIHCEFKTHGWSLYKIAPINGQIFNEVIKESDDSLTNVNIENEYFFMKNEFDIWSGNKEYEKFFLENFDKNTEIDVCGVALNYCVFQNVIGMVERGYKVNIVKNAVKGITFLPNGDIDASYEANIQKMIDLGVSFI